MPRRGRNTIQRHCDQAVNTADRIIYHMAVILQLYDGNYPRQEEAVRLIISFTKELQTFIKQFKRDLV